MFNFFRLALLGYTLGFVLSLGGYYSGHSTPLFISAIMVTLFSILLFFKHIEQVIEQKALVSIDDTQNVCPTSASSVPSLTPLTKSKAELEAEELTAALIHRVKNYRIGDY